MLPRRQTGPVLQTAIWMALSLMAPGNITAARNGTCPRERAAGGTLVNNEIAEHYAGDPLSEQKARLSLAEAILSVATETSRDVEVFKNAGLQVMALNYRSQLLAGPKVSNCLPRSVTRTPPGEVIPPTRSLRPLHLLDGDPCLGCRRAQPVN